MGIKQYILESEKQYRLRIKTIIEIDDDAMDRIERVLSKYEPLEISRPKKTILQRHPLDFNNVDSAEVWIVDAVFALPASPGVVKEDIRKILNAPESFVVVRDDDEALELETLRLNAIKDIEEEAEKLGLKPTSLLSTDPLYAEVEISADQLFGDEYNNMLLGYLGKVQDERKNMEVKAQSPLFDFLDMPKEQEPAQDKADFNASIKDAPKVKPKFTKVPSTTQYGTVKQIGSDTISRAYMDKTGKRVILARKLGEV